SGFIRASFHSTMFLTTYMNPDIDECKYNRGGCMYFCENLPGGYRCACPSDMMLAADKISCVPFTSKVRSLSLVEPDATSVTGLRRVPASLSLPTLILANIRPTEIVNTFALHYQAIVTCVLADLDTDWRMTRNGVYVFYWKSQIHASSEMVDVRTFVSGQTPIVRNAPVARAMICKPTDAHA
ncbi:EGF-like domain protein, partial [Opisthorchis viverrini]